MGGSRGKVRQGLPLGGWVMSPQCGWVWEVINVRVTNTWADVCACVGVLVTLSCLSGFYLGAISKTIRFILDLLQKFPYSLFLRHRSYTFLESFSILLLKISSGFLTCL